MSISPDSIERGCAANFPQPVSEENVHDAQVLIRSVHRFNCVNATDPLPDIVYRNSSNEEDIVHHVFRWDTTLYPEVFQHGFQARAQQSTPDEDYYNLQGYVRSGRPLDPTRSPYAFVSTTLDSGWYPQPPPGTNETRVYRYEIYAPGGISVAQTLRDRNEFVAQDEVCFVAGIAPQYIRSAQLFRVWRTDDGRPRRARIDKVIIVNGRYDPQSHPQRLLYIQRPIFDYWDPENRRRPPLTMRIYGPQLPRREKREVSVVDSDPTDWYADKVANFESYINAAFRSSTTNEAYLFMMDEYVLVDYAPGTTNDRVVNGPLLICDGYPSLAGTAFAEYGIDCAFGSHYKNEAFIFSGKLSARINFAPGTTYDWIIKGPMTIAEMFPFFKSTVFESGVDAAFEASATDEAYLFRGNQYALINYVVPSQIAVRPITQGFASLKDTIFESGIDAAFASHRTDEAYLFKGDSYALINFAPGTTDDYIIGGVKKILPNWPSLATILPRKNRGLDVLDHTKPDAGLDVHDHTKPDADRDHDEL